MCYPPDPEPAGWLDAALLVVVVAIILAAVVLGLLYAGGWL